VHLEGCATAVSASFTIPAQPTTGNLTYVPLGGDGYSAPFAAWSVVNHTATGDATGGAIVCEVILDNRFVSLVSFVTVDNTQATPANADLRISVDSVTGARQIPQMRFQNLVVATSATLSTNTIGRTWNPPPQLLPGGSQSGRIRGEMVNVDTDVMRLGCFIYEFRIDVREKTPMGPLLWARGSGATQ